MFGGEDEDGNGRVEFNSHNNNRKSSNRTQNDDDAGSDVDPNEFNQNKKNFKGPGPSIDLDVEDNLGGNKSDLNQSLREIQDSPRWEWKNNHQQQQTSTGVLCICLMLFIIFVGIVLCLGCYKEGMVEIKGYFGDGDLTWSYGWEKLTIITTDSLSAIQPVDIPGMMEDFRRLIELSCTIGVVGVIFGIGLLAFRYGTDTPLFITFCGVKILQRPWLYSIFDSIGQLFFVALIMCLVASIYGLLDMLSDVGPNCKGQCTAICIPWCGYGGLLIVAITAAAINLNFLSNFDVVLAPQSMKYYYPQNFEAAMSRNTPINLNQVLKSITGLRKIIINSMILLCFEKSSLICVAVKLWIGTNYYWTLTTQGYDLSSDVDAKYISGGTTSNILMFIVICSFFLMLYLWNVITSYQFGCLRFIYHILVLIQCFAFTITFALYYYQFYQYTFPGSHFWTPDWGIVIVISNFFSLSLLVYRAFQIIPSNSK